MSGSYCCLNFLLLQKDHILSGESAIAEVKDETASPLSPLEGILLSLELGNMEGKPPIMGEGYVVGKPG